MSTFIYGLREVVGKIIICGSIARERISSRDRGFSRLESRSHDKSSIVSC
ncbi:MAG: hypothetical protein V2I56_09180 [Desulfobacteraceae bacterium]|nr:hypothetical protein [Desulfobacteraceae bacterium]